MVNIKLAPDDLTTGNNIPKEKKARNAEVGVKLNINKI
jgi:hypothetical protein